VTTGSGTSTGSVTSTAVPGAVCTRSSTSDCVSYGVSEMTR
jgi:hypothetical protein